MLPSSPRDELYKDDQNFTSQTGPLGSNVKGRCQPYAATEHLFLVTFDFSPLCSLFSLLTVWLPCFPVMFTYLRFVTGNVFTVP